MQIRFWGTRGSIAKAGPSTVRYGGNTSCVEIRSRKGTTVLLDCGTGAHGLGASLLREPGGPREGHILVSHTHWDHIQGLPFFGPLFVPGQRWRVYGPRGLGPSLGEVMEGQMQFTYFPITPDKFAAEVTYCDLVEGQLEIDDIKVTAQYLNHPGLTLGYRLEVDGVTVVYATDHEPHLRRLADGGTPPPGSEDERHGQFLADADLVIHDTQYTADEYPDRVGWGHSTMEYVVDMARAAAVRRVAMFHHDPMRDDDALDALLGRARERVAKSSARRLEVLAAAEGRTLVLEAQAPRRVTVSQPAVEAKEAVIEAALVDSPVLMLAEEGVELGLMRTAALADRLRLLTATNLEQARAIIQHEQPALVIVPRYLGDRDCLLDCHDLREARGDDGEAMPLVVYGREADVDPEAGQRMSVTAWLECPFSAEYARARMRAWLLRTPLRWVRAPLPIDHDERERIVRSLGLLGTPPEERFERHTRLVRSLFRVPLAWINLLAGDIQFSKSYPEGAGPECHRDIAFCAHTILGDDVFEVPDTLADDRFAHNPAVLDGPRLRFYAGMPLLHRNRAIGALCIGDVRPRKLDEEGRSHLRTLGQLVEEELARS